jgi:hypothetical protein
MNLKAATNGLKKDLDYDQDKNYDFFISIIKVAYLD